MSRKPITEYAGGKGPRQRIWEAIRKADGPFTDNAIWSITDNAEIDINMGAIREYRRALVHAGIVGVVEESGKFKPGIYRLVKDEGLEAPRVRKDGQRVTQGLAQEQMWRTLRLLTADTNARELAAHASTAAIQVAEGAADDYLKVLHHAGYLACTREGHGLGFKGLGVQSRYKLKPARNTGPRPPMVCRTRVVYDPNEDKVVWAARVTDEDAIHGK